MLELNDAVRVAAAGGGMVVSARNHVPNDLVRIAAAAAGKARIYIQDANIVSTNELVRIGAAGKGSVVFLGPGPSFAL